MKIGFVATEVGLQEGGAYMGGNVNNVVTVASELADRGHEVHIITTRPRDAAPNPAEKLRFSTVHEQNSRFGHGTPGYFASFASFATRIATGLYRAGELDVLTVHAGFTIWGAVGRAVGTLSDCPVVHVQYCPLDQPSGSRLHDWLQHPRLSRQYLAGADAIVGISRNTADSISRVTGRQDVRVILPAIDTESYRPLPESEKSDVPVISYLGSLSPQKGLDLLVDAFERVRESYDCRLELGLEVRSERSESPLARRIRADSDIEVRGIIEDVPMFLARSQVFAVPFRTTMGPADYPLAALEAMSCGVPLVVTDVGGLRALMYESDGGVCVGTPTVDHVEAGLQNLLENPPQRRIFGANARIFVSAACGLEHIVRQYESALTDVVDYIS
jgi:glycosyltransferase involved in cell wall biosynthesis